MYRIDVQKRSPNATVMACLAIVLAGFLLSGCAGTSRQATAKPEEANKQVRQEAKQLLKPQYAELPAAYKPTITWKPSFTLKEMPPAERDGHLPDLKVGAEINTRGGKVPLYQVVKALADLKGMNVSWASDVDQTVPVSVKVTPESSFWDALDNILRQADYFCEYKNGTIVVKYKDTKKFHVINPFVTANYRTSVGGDFLGASTGDFDTGMRGELGIDHTDEEIDLWQTIENNLSRILDLSTITVPETDTSLSDREIAAIEAECRRQHPSNPTRERECVQQQIQMSQEQLAAQQQSDQQASQGQGGSGAGDRQGFFFTIDKPLGIVTVTAPRSLLEKVENYIETINKELSRQVIIEAKIVEVSLEDSTSTGIDWSGLLSGQTFSFEAAFGDDNNYIYPKEGVKLLRSISLQPISFDLVLSFLNEYGEVRTLANPKLSLLNGQPAMIAGGTTHRIVSRVTTVVDTSGGSASTSYTVEPEDIMEGVGLGVIANIAENDEIVLQLTPITSVFENKAEDDLYRTIGTVEIALPKIQLREMTTMARVKSGQLLVIGGIILETKGNAGTKVPVLGDLPVVGKYIFSSNTDYVLKKELVILLRPQIVEL